jgi:CheY-specific phosphatase CheX
MDKSVLTEAMKASISEVLEQMFFMPIDFVAPDAAPSDPQSGSAAIIAKLGFSGPYSGTFMLQVPAVLGQSVSADFLGIAAPRLSSEQVTGTVLEMVNMLAGGTLSIYDSHALFDLQMPELICTHDVHALTAEAPDGILLRIQTPESRMTFQLIIQ